MLLTALQNDKRDEVAVGYHILLKCCKTPNTEMLFEDFKWIIDRANFLYAIRANLSLISYNFLNWNTDAKLIPSEWDADWRLMYQIDKEGKLKKVRSKDSSRSYLDFISEAGLETLNKVIWRWKLYGKIQVRLKNFFTKGF